MKGPFDTLQSDRQAPRPDEGALAIDWLLWRISRGLRVKGPKASPDVASVLARLHPDQLIAARELLSVVEQELG